MHRTNRAWLYRCAFFSYLPNLRNKGLSSKGKLNPNDLRSAVPELPSTASFSFFKTESLSRRLEYSGVISAHCNLRLLGSSNSHASASQAAGIIDIHHHAQLIFVFLVETGFHQVG